MNENKSSVDKSPKQIFYGKCFFLLILRYFFSPFFIKKNWNYYNTKFVTQHMGHPTFHAGYPDKMVSLERQSLSNAKRKMQIWDRKKIYEFFIYIKIFADFTRHTQWIRFCSSFSYKGEEITNLRLRRSQTQCKRVTVVRY